MSKDLEQLRLNMITSLMELDHKSLSKVKAFMESEAKIGWKDHINDRNVEFVDYSKLSKISKSTDKEDTKPNIIFL